MIHFVLFKKLLFLMCKLLSFSLESFALLPINQNIIWGQIIQSKKEYLKKGGKENFNFFLR